MTPDTDASTKSRFPGTTTSRTAAATRARQRAAARRAAIRLGVQQVEHLDDSYLISLAAALIGEVERRGLEVPRDFPQKKGRERLETLTDEAQKKGTE